MRLSTVCFVGLPLLLSLAACTAQGSSTVVSGPSGAPSTPVFPGTGDGQSDGGTTTGGATDYEALFGPPSGADATPGSLNGLWAGTSGYVSADTRLVFSGTSIIMALKCGTDTIGIDVVARVTSSSIKTLESKSYVPPPQATGTSGGTAKTSSSCTLHVVPAEVPRCTSTTDYDAQSESGVLTNGCFFLSGTNLTFYDSNALVGPSKLTKLSD